MTNTDKARTTTPHHAIDAKSNQRHTTRKYPGNKRRYCFERVVSNGGVTEPDAAANQLLSGQLDPRWTCRRPHNATRRSSCAFSATTTVLKDMRIAPTAGFNTMPQGASTPAASGIAAML